MILIKNWSENDVIYHSVVILNGEVQNSDHGEIIITVKDKKPLSWPVVSGSFRVLVELEPGESVILLKCGLEEEKLKLRYEKSRRKNFVRLVYIVCSKSSGEFQGPETEDCSVKNAKLKLCFGAKVIQVLTAEKLRDSNLEPRTFSLEEDENGNVICHVFRSQLTTEETHAKSQQSLWDHFALEIMNSELKNDNCKFLAFLSSTRYIALQPGEKQPVKHSEVLSRTRGHVALGGGGLALIGTACLHTWPSGLADFQDKLEDITTVNKSHFMDDSCNRSQLWACYISSLGASLHELAHTFDVGHSHLGIMGLGFHQLQQELQVYQAKNCCVCSRNAHFQEKLQYKDDHSCHNSAVPDKTLKPVVIQWTTPCKHCPDGPFWNPSAARILYYHKWFLIDDDDSVGSVSCKPTHKGWLVSSSNGIAVAELRDPDGLVLVYWHCGKSTSPPVTVHLPRGPLLQKVHLLVVQDTKGNLLKIELSNVNQKSFS